MKGTSSREIILTIKDIINSEYADTTEKGKLVQNEIRTSFKVLNADIILDFSGIKIVVLDFLKEIINTYAFTRRLKGKNINSDALPLLKEAFAVACQNSGIHANLELHKGDDNHG